MAENAVVVHKTDVGLRAELIISGEDVEVQGVLGSDFFFALSQEAKLGTPISFAYWLKEVYQVDSDGMKMLTLEDYEDLEAFQKEYKADKARQKSEKVLPTKIIANLKDRGVPEQVHQLMMTALLAELSITDLVIDIKKIEKVENGASLVEERKKLKFGLAITFPSPLRLLPNIDVKRVSILILHTPADDTKFPIVQKQLDQPEPIKTKAVGFIAFDAVPQAAGTITLGGATWSFVAGEPKANETGIVDGDLDKTLVALARDLNRFDNPDAIRKCTYRADLQNGRLLVEYDEPGPEGNAFTLAADTKSKGERSAPTLQGGADPEAPLPKLPAPEPAPAPAPAPASLGQSTTIGTIKFKKVPTESNTITLNSTVFTFKKNAKGDTEVEVGPDIQLALEALIAKINNVDALGEFSFTHDVKNTLKVSGIAEYNPDEFVLEGEPTAIFEVSKTKKAVA